MYRRILVAIDGSPTATKGLQEALRLARLTQAKLCLLHMVDEILHITGFETFEAYAHDVLPRLKAAGLLVGLLEHPLARRAGVEAEERLCMASADRLCDVLRAQAEAWGADLIVIGTHGRKGVNRMLLGSDAEQVVRTARVPVLLVRGEPN